MPSKREIQQYEAEQSAAGWHSMTMLAAHVQAGHLPARVDPTIMCRQGEEQYGTLPVDAQLYCGADVEWASGMRVSGGLLFMGAALAANAAMNAKKKRDAEAAARPQWRPWGRFPAIITNQRVLLMTEQWTSFYFQQLIMIEPNPTNYAVALHFEGSTPIMLRGPWVPWATVAICAALFGKPWPPGYNPPPAVQVPAQPAAQQIPVHPAPDQTPPPELPPGQGYQY